MFEQARAGRSWLGGFLGLTLIGGVAIAALRPGLLDAALDQADLLASGVTPGTELLATAHVDQPYRRSPLLLAMALEEVFTEVDGRQGEALGDAIAEELGRWMLQQTGASDLDAAERALWAAGRQDELFVELATRLRAHEVHARNRHRLSQPDPEGEGQPVYVHPDDLPWLMAHVLWRLDVRAELVRSPVHHYLVARAPDGGGSRAIEATCFRRVDALGKVVQSDQPSVGRRLVQPEGHYPSGVGGIRNPDPLPAGAYVSFLDDDSLATGVLERLEERYGPADERRLCAAAAAWSLTLARCSEEDAR